HFHPFASPVLSKIYAPWQMLNVAARGKVTGSCRSKRQRWGSTTPTWIPNRLGIPLHSFPHHHGALSCLESSQGSREASFAAPSQHIGPRVLHPLPRLS